MSRSKSDADRQLCDDCGVAPPKNPESFAFRIFSFVSAGHNIICVAHATSFELSLNIIVRLRTQMNEVDFVQMMCFAMM